MASEFQRVGKNKLTFPKGFDWPRKPFVYLDVTGSPIIIEEGVTFSSGVYILTHTHEFHKSNWRDLPYSRTKQPTIFKRYCFIGVYTIILDKCKIVGEHAVIAAGSVVTQNIPAYEIWGGNPARKLGEVQKVK